MRGRDGGKQETGSSRLVRAVEHYELVVVVKMEPDGGELRELVLERHLLQ